MRCASGDSRPGCPTAVLCLDFGLYLASGVLDSSFVGWFPVTAASSASMCNFPRRLLALPGWRFSCDAWLLPGQSGGFSLFSSGFDGSDQLQPGLFRHAMMSMLQRQDAGGFFFRPQLIFGSLFALFRKIFWNRLSRHTCECGRTIPPKSVLFCPLDDNSGPRISRRPWRRAAPCPLRDVLSAMLV
jgi:hypothetical protein